MHLKSLSFCLSIKNTIDKQKCIKKIITQLDFLLSVQNFKQGVGIRKNK